MKQALSYRWLMRIPGLSKVWNAVAAFAANCIAVQRTLPQHMVVFVQARRNYLGASHGISAVSAAAAVRCFAEIVEHGTHDERVLAALRNLVPLSLFAGQCEADIRFSLNHIPGSSTEDGIGHAAHLGGAAFGLFVAALAPLAAAAARSLGRAQVSLKAQPPARAPRAPTRVSMSPW